MTTSLVIETWNTGGDVSPLFSTVASLGADLELVSEVVISHEGAALADRQALEGACSAPVVWLEVPRGSSYYDHKNLGFEAAGGAVVSFLDGDCQPEPGWLAALLAPFADGAQVVAGVTSYRGPLAPIANAIDFPLFDARSRRIAGDPEAVPVQNFFANNVAFAREIFATRGYPSIESMFHGQCQVLALELARDEITIELAPRARVTHAWPQTLRELIAVRVLRGADGATLLPRVLLDHAPRSLAITRRLGPLPALAIIAARSLEGAARALASGPRLGGLGFVATSAVLDSVGVLFARRVYRHYGVS